MESYNFISEVIDREDESEEIKKDLRISQYNKVRFVYAPSAVGKSSLSKKVIEKYGYSDRFVIQVKTNPEISTSNISDWLYIDIIFDSINQHFSHSQTHKKYCFDSYIKSSKDQSLKRQLYECILEQVASCKSKIDLISIFLIYRIKKQLRIGEFDSYKITDSNSYNSRMIKIRYILYVLKNLDIFMVIDNIQNIDTVSWKYLLSWLSMTRDRRHYCLFEYTLSENHTFESMIKLMEQIRDTGLYVECSKLSKLPDEYVVDVIDKQFPYKPQDLNFNINLLNQYKSDPVGNIRKLIDYTINYSSNDNYSSKKKISDSPTLKNILNLKNIVSKYIFAILVHCNGEASKDLVNTLLESININLFDVENAMLELKNKQFIEDDDVKIKLFHSSLSDEWKNNKQLFEEYDKLAYANLEKYFSHILFESGDKNEKDYAWLFLLQIYSVNNPKKIQNLLLAINNAALEQVSPKNTWEYLSQLINYTKSDIFMLQEMYFSILKICFEMELYNEGYQCIKLMENALDINKINRLLLFKCMFLSALDKHEENINLYNKYIVTVSKYSRTYFNLKLIVLCSYRSLNQYDKCLEIHKELSKKRQLMDDYEYCMFLRLTNVYLSDNKAVSYAKKSVRKFHCLGNNIQESKSLITYAKLLAGLGHCKKAIALIKKSENLLNNKYIGRHMIYTNHAAFLLMKGIADDNVWLLLEQSECTAIVSYDKLAIIVNKLVWCYQNKYYDVLDSLIHKSKELIPMEPDEHVHVLIYYNLYLIFKQKGDIEKAKYYFKLSYDNKDKCRFVKARFDKTKCREMRYRLRYPWHICFLSYWTYDLDDSETAVE